MELENYFDFLSEEDIRIKGTRVGIETILDDYLEGASPGEIAVRYRSLSLEQVYATITYYLRNQDQVSAYLEAWRRYVDQMSREHDLYPSETAKRYRQLKEAGGQAPEFEFLSGIPYLLDENMPHAMRDQLLLRAPDGSG